MANEREVIDGLFYEAGAAGHELVQKLRDLERRGQFEGEDHELVRAAEGVLWSLQRLHAKVIRGAAADSWSTLPLLLVGLLGLAGCDDNGGGLPELPDAARAAVAADLALTFPEVDAALPCVVDVDCPGAAVCFEGRCVELPDLAPAGCASDDQCKGARVCVGGFCVDPAPADLAVVDHDDDHDLIMIDASTPMDSSARTDGIIGSDLARCGYAPRGFCRFADGGAQWCVWQQGVMAMGACGDPGNFKGANSCDELPDAGGIVVGRPLDGGIGCAYQPE